MARYLVVGVGVAGTAAARALAERGHEVVVYNSEPNDALAALRDIAASTLSGDGVDASVLANVDEVVVSPGIPPHHPIVLAAQSAGCEVYSEPELAWRLRPTQAEDWLAITGTNGKTTATSMLAAILQAAGHRTSALGNIGLPLVDAVNVGYDVLAVELSSQQLHWSRQLSPQVGALLNLADDHLSWHGDAEAYATAKTSVWRGGTAVGNLDDERVAALLAQAPGRHVGFTLRVPAPGQFGVQNGHIIDHTGSTPLRLFPTARVRPAGFHNVANAVAAVAVARCWGVPPEAVAAGLDAYDPVPHRNVEISTVAGVRYVDDSKGTNPHATAAAIGGYDRIIWIAGGQLKGVDVKELVNGAAPRLKGAVLLGVDRALIGAELAEAAPDVPVIDVPGLEPDSMNIAVRAAAELASPGDVVLLSPAAASYDMFIGYADRGQRFATAVAQLSASDAR